MQKGNIIIAGGSGLIGTALRETLQAHGFYVEVLSRKQGSGYRLWNPAEGQIDTAGLHDFNIVINLTGTGIADKRWSKKRKKEILSSRVDPLQLLAHTAQELNWKPDVFIGASGIGYYGDRADTLLTEASAGASGFMSATCQKWEAASRNFAQYARRACLLRLGVVLSNSGGALPMMATPTRFGIGAALGSGKQYMSWIHIQDLLAIFQFLINQDLQGTFNVVTPQPVRNAQFQQILSRSMHRPDIMPAVPAWILHLLLGEMKSIVLESTRVSSQKLQAAGFEFQFPELENALDHLLHPSKP